MATGAPTRRLDILGQRSEIALATERQGLGGLAIAHWVLINFSDLAPYLRATSFVGNLHTGQSSVRKTYPRIGFFHVDPPKEKISSLEGIPGRARKIGTCFLQLRVFHPLAFPTST